MRRQCRTIAAIQLSTKNVFSFFYDYFVKDHLGNVRMVLTEESQTDVYPAATLEGNINATGVPNAINIENSFYSINTSYVVNKAEATGITNYQNNNVVPNNNPYSNTTANSEKLYKLHSNTNKTGLGILLKVMAGDVIHIFGKSYYFENNTGGSSANQLIPVADIAAGLTGAPSGLLAGKVTPGQLTGNSSFNSSVFSFLTNPQRNDNSNPQRPKAAVNWLLMNEQMKFVTGNFSPVGAPNVVKDHYNTDASMQNITIDKSGYIYIYVSNESPVNVFFDNLQVGHTRGAVLEETHYYPFGLTMSGISSKAANTPTNKYQFSSKEMQNKEFADGSGLESYDFHARMQDPQTGRFLQIDQLASKLKNINYSPYSYAINNPIRVIDPDGRDWRYIMRQENGKTYIDITFTATIVNDSKQKFSPQEMKNLRNEIQKQLENTFSKDFGDITFTMKADIRVAKNNKDIRKNEHAYRITDGQIKATDRKEPYQVATAVAEFGGKEIFIRKDFIKDIVSGSDKNTISHETGHTGWLLHPDMNYSKNPGNLVTGPWQNMTGQNFNVNNMVDPDNLMNSDPMNSATNLLKSQFVALVKAMNGGSISVNRETVNGVLDNFVH